MPPKADSPAAVVPPAEPGVSGKWVILGILAVALAAAGGSWIFRYNATHRAVEFWGPQAAQLIRDAPTVLLRRLPDETKPTPTPQLRDKSTFYDFMASAPAPIDISSAHGLVHFRNALLEDRSYRWPEAAVGPEDRWRWAMTFRSKDDRELTLIFSSDLHAVTKDCPSVETPRKLNCEPIARGLEEMFVEFTATGTSPPASPSKPAEATSPNADAAK